MTPGQAAYERDLVRQPTYDDGRPRVPWIELKPWAQQSWERNPTAKDEEPEAPRPLPQGLLSLEALSKLPGNVEDIDDNCLYFLWRGEELLYLGATTQASERIARHIRDRNRCSAQSGRPIPFDRCTFLVVSDRRLMWRLETQYQKHYDPPYNVVSYRRRSY